MTASMRPLPRVATPVLALPPDAGSLTADLHELVRVLATVPEGTGGSTADLSSREHEDLLRSVDRAVDEGLAVLVQRARDRGEHVPSRPSWTAVRTVRGLLLSRLVGRPVDPAQVPDLVDRVLLPLLHRGLHGV